MTSSPFDPSENADAALASTAQLQVDQRALQAFHRSTVSKLEAVRPNCLEPTSRHHAPSAAERPGRPVGGSSKTSYAEPVPGFASATQVHRLVFAGDVGGLQRLLEDGGVGEDLEARDRHGNTPLLLAVKRGFVNVALLLIRAGANVDVQSSNRFHLMDEAVLLQDGELVLQIFIKLQRRKLVAWRRRAPALHAALRDLPDFAIEMKWHFDTANVFKRVVAALSPNETYKIWVRGTWVRVDFSIRGFGKRGFAKRGRFSIVVHGEGSSTPGEAFVVDRVSGQARRLLRKLEAPTAGEACKAVRRLLTQGRNHADTMEVGLSKLVFRPRAPPGGADEAAPEELVGQWRCRAYEGSCQVRATVKSKRSHTEQLMSQGLYFDADESCEVPHAQADGEGGIRTKQFRKNVRAVTWMTEDLPLSVKELRPVLEVLGWLHDEQISRLRTLLSLHGIPDDAFPAKVSIPLVMGVQANVTFENARVEPIPRSTFDFGNLEEDLGPGEKQGVDWERVTYADLEAVHGGPANGKRESPSKPNLNGRASRTPRQPATPNAAAGAAGGGGVGCAWSSEEEIEL